MICFDLLHIDEAREVKGGVVVIRVPVLEVEGAVLVCVDGIGVDVVVSRRRNYANKNFTLRALSSTKSMGIVKVPESTTATVKTPL